VTQKFSFQRALKQAICLLSAGTCALAVLVLLGLSFGMKDLVAFGRDRVPMSHTGAIMALALGGSALVLPLWPRFALLRRLAGVVDICVVGLSLLRLVGNPFPSTSLLTIMAMLFAALSALACGLRREPGWRLRQAGALLAQVPLVTGTMVLVSYVAGAPVLYGSGSVPMSLPSALCAVNLGLALMLSAGPDTWPLALFGFVPGKEGVLRAHWFTIGPLVMFLALSVLILSGGSFFLRGQLKATRSRVQSDLSMIADLKVRQIENWYGERRDDADQLFDSALLQDQFHRFLTGSAHAPPEAQIRGWMERLQKKYYTRLILFDGQGKVRLDVPLGQPSAGEKTDAAELQAVLRSGTVLVQDLHRLPDSPAIRLNLWVPIGAGTEPGARAKGALMMTIAPEAFLYPLVRSWPAPNSSAETLLFRPEGDEIVYLNELHHRARSALTLRVLIGKYPGLQSFLAGRKQEELVAYHDYRGVPVLGVLRRVGGTSWVMVAKIDEAEVYGPLRQRVWAGSFGLIGVLVLVAAGLGLMVHYHDAGLTRKQLFISQRFEWLMREANDIILLMDGEGRILEANIRAVEQYGYALPELQTMHIGALRGPGIRVEAAEQFERLKRLGAIRFETIHYRRDGSNFPVEVSGRFVLLDGVAQVLSIVHDITERERAAAELWTSRERLRQVLVNFPGVVFWKDTDLVYLGCNRAFAEGAGFSDPLGIVGKTDLELPWTADEAKAYRADDREVLESRVARLGRIESQTQADGRLVWFETSKVPFLDADGTLLGVLGIAQNITESKLAHEERQAIEAQLKHSQNLESLGSLAGGVAHDMNNVMGAILILASSLREKAAPTDPICGSLDMIVNSCLRGRGVVQSLLYFAHKDIQEDKPLDLNAMVREMAHFLAHTTLKRIQFEMDLQEDLRLVCGDESALSHALMNLCVNAVDAMPGGGTLRITTYCLPDGGIAARVRDTGEGMSAEVLAKSMEPFFTTKAVGKGTGLGLSMVYGTMRAHDGALEMTSELGKGTEAVLVFPASRISQSLSVPRSPAEIPLALRVLDILLVDDDELILESMAEVLEGFDHRVVIARGGAEAIHLLETALRADVVILDMNMPGMNGAQALPLILAQRPGQRVLMVTGYSDHEIAPLKAGRPNVQSLRKPFAIKELQDKLAELVIAQAP